MKPMIRSFVLLLVFAVLGFAQSSQKNVPQEKQRGKSKPAVVPVKESGESAAAPNPRLERAVLLVNQVAGEAKQMEQKDEASRIVARAGELLWPQNPDAAKGYFRDAFELATEFDHSQSQAQSPGAIGSQKRAPTMRVGIAGNARQQVIRTVAKLDADLAEKLVGLMTADVKDSAANSETEGPFSDSVSQSSAAYLAAASAMLETNPAKAAELASMSLKDGIPQGLPSFLFHLSLKSPIAADTLYRASLARARVVPFGTSALGAASLLAAYPFGDTQVTYGDGSTTMMMGFAAQDEKHSAPNPALQVEYLNFAYSLIMAQLPEGAPSDDNEARQRDALYGTLVSLGQSLTAKFSRVQPDHAAAVDERVRVLATQLSTNRRNNLANGRPGLGAFGPSPQSGDDPVQRGLDKADSASNPRERMTGYLEAAMAANRKKDFDRAREIAQKVTDPDGREDLLNFINFDAAQAAIDKGELDEARSLAYSIKKLDQRVFVLANIAEVSLKKEDRSRTVDLLDETEKLALKADDSPEKGVALIRVVTVYGQIDPLRAFEVLVEAVETVNRLKDFDFQQRLVRKVSVGGWQQVSGFSAGGTSGFELTMTKLAGEDFDRALAAAQKFQQPNLSDYAVLAVCKSVLAPVTLDKKTPGTNE